MDQFTEQAFGVLTSGQLLDALDVSREDARLRERYGKGDAKVHGDAAPMLNEQFLVARRLVEAGARVVTVAYGFWDYHGNNFRNARADLPLLDQALHALITDLHETVTQNRLATALLGPASPGSFLLQWFEDSANSGSLERRCKIQAVLHFHGFVFPGMPNETGWRVGGDLRLVGEELHQLGIGRFGQYEPRHVQHLRRDGPVVPRARQSQLGGPHTAAQGASVVSRGCGRRRNL